MCPLRAYLRQKILSQSGQESLALDRSAVEALLGGCSGCPCGGQVESGPVGAMTVGELAAAIEVGRSTVRGWCKAGLFGSEDIRVGRSWMIPAAQVALTVSRYRAGWRVVRDEWVQPGMPPKKENAPEGPSQPGKPTDKALETGDDGGPASRPPPDYGGYRDD